MKKNYKNTEINRNTRDVNRYFPEFTMNLYADKELFSGTNMKENTENNRKSNDEMKVSRYTSEFTKENTYIEENLDINVSIFSEEKLDKKSYIFVHSEWTDRCILNEKKYISRSLNNEIGKFRYDNKKIIINWEKWNGDDIFIYIYNCYYHINFFNKYINNYNIDIIDLYFNKLNTKFIVNKDKNLIINKYNLKQIGDYILHDKYFIIKWHIKHYNDDYFYKLNNKYYHENYLLILINNDLNEDNNIKLNDNINSLLLCEELTFEKNINIISDTEDNRKYNDAMEVSLYTQEFTKENTNLDAISDASLDTDSDSDIENNRKYNDEMKVSRYTPEFAKKNTENNHNYNGGSFIFSEINTKDSISDSDSESDIESVSSSNSESKNYEIKNNIIKETFKKINNKFYFINEKIYKYNIINIDLKKNNIIKNLNNLSKNINIQNTNYINKQNIHNYIDTYNNNNDLENILIIELDFEIPIKTKKRILSLVEWGYPPFGGVENWLLNLNNFFYKNNYDNYLICFSDPFKNEYFSKIQLIDLKYVKVIQMPKNILYIIKLIKLINPDIINHQGIYREYFMKISNVLEIPFLTGFCFWNNIINCNIHNLNINMINNDSLVPTEEFSNILDNSYTYASSNFVNDIIDKLYDIKLDVIESISIKEEFYIDKELHKNDLNYVTLINCHYNKCGHIIQYLCENLDINIPLQVIYTENDPDICADFVKSLIENRNIKKNINILSLVKIDVKNIYNKTRILLIPYLCDETFCRVAYEGMINKLPIISTKNGNLKYLLKDYAKFIDGSNHKKWKKTIESLYYNNDAILEYYNKVHNNLTETIVEKKIIDKLNEIKESKYKLNQNNIGMIVPWADQGLGIQSRDYYISLKELGYTPHIFSFKPYHATYENILLQSNKEEWVYDNICYSNNYREDITYDEILDFVYKYNIKTIIIIEATFLNIFKIAAFLKFLNINIYLVVNIECIRLVELEYHLIFDKILTNNNTSNKILSHIFKNNVNNLGFHINYPYFQKKKILLYWRFKFN